MLACFGDEGVEAARELVRILVLGPLNVGLHVAGVIGHKTLLLVTDYRGGRYLSLSNVARYGLENRVIIWGTNASIPEAFNAFAAYTATGQISPFINEMADIYAKSIEEDATDVIVFGCGALKWMKEVLEEQLDKRGYSITVINPLPVAVRMAELLITMKLSHNLVGYPMPPAVSDRYGAK